jgi:hypothetical protein
MGILRFLVMFSLIANPGRMPEVISMKKYGSVGGPAPRNSNKAYQMIVDLNGGVARSYFNHYR